MGGFELMKGECRSCGAEIYWTETEKGRRMPVDVEPSEEGNLRLIWMYNAGSPKLLAKHDKDSDQLELEEDLLNKYKSHFGTCDQSKRLEEEMNIGADYRGAGVLRWVCPSGSLRSTDRVCRDNWPRHSFVQEQPRRSLR